MRTSHLLRFVAAAFAIGVAGCVTSDRVLQDNGSTAWDVSCTNGYACHDEAQRRCGGDYVVLDDNTSILSRHRSVRIQCADDYVAAQRPLGPPTMENPRETARGIGGLASVPAADRLVCTRAYERFPAMARMWSTQRPGAQPGDEPSPIAPRRTAFLETCTALPETQQLCLVASYEGAHRTACAEQMAQLSGATLDALDAMLIKRHPPFPNTPSATRDNREP